MSAGNPPFERASRWHALAVLLLGLSTLAWPMVSVEPPAAGRTAWSLADIFAAMSGGMVATAFLYDADMLRLLLAYGAMLFGMLVLWAGDFYKPLAVVSLLGLCGATAMIAHGRYDFARWLGGKAIGWRGVVSYQPTVYVLPALFIVLLLIANGGLRRRTR